jgi:hypothetical protein
MKHSLTAAFLWLILLSGCSKKSGSATAGTTTADSATVTVINGYGSGQYKIGDTVNIWAEAIPAGSVFNTWTGYNSLLENTGEWHNSFVMPSENVTVTATNSSLTPFTLTYEVIRGMNIPKNVYYYFPASQVSQKGIVYLLHGTGGSAQTLVNNFEWQTTINDLVAAGYAIVVTESEETSLNENPSGLGYQWQPLPLDTLTNPDYGNFRALTDTFYNRGYTNPSVPRYSIGMSNGGEFSAALSYIYKYAAGVSYCAPSGTTIASSSVTPLQFCMAKYDNNPSVGPTGDANAQTNSSTLTSRDICSQFYLHDHSPVYPQRFARWSQISLTTSASIYNELKANYWLDNNNYLTAASDTISVYILANPSAYPVTSSLNNSLFTYINDEIDIMYAAHQYYSDLAQTTIHFLEAPCQ